MNIFILDEIKSVNAENHCDKHVVKMILEYAQLLSAAHHIYDSEYANQVYKLTHKNHPCTKWVCESAENYDYLYELFILLCKEYTYRYGRTHLTETKMSDLLKNNPVLTGAHLTPFAQAMPEYCKDEDAVKAYRNYYNNEKTHLFKWTKRDKPEWTD